VYTAKTRHCDTITCHWTHWDGVSAKILHSTKLYHFDKWLYCNFWRYTNYCLIAYARK